MRNLVRYTATKNLIAHLMSAVMYIVQCGPKSDLVSECSQRPQISIRHSVFIQSNTVAGM